MVMIIRVASLVLGGLLIYLSYVDSPILGGELGFGWTQAILLAIGIALMLSCLTKLELNKNILTIFLSIVITLTICELGLRATLASRFNKPYQVDEKYLYKLIPGAVSEYRHLPVNGGEIIYQQVNEHGFRGAKLKHESRAKRVVIYGDSFIHAQFSSLENTFPEQLARSLRDQLNEPFEAINAGIAGYGPDQAYLRMQDELSWLKPDLVIFSIYAGNDYGDLVRNKLFRVIPGGIQANSPTLEPAIARNFELSRHELVIKKILRETHKKTSSVEHLTPPDMDSRFAGLLQEYNEFVTDKDDVVRVLLTDAYNADFSLQRDLPSAAYKTKLMSGVISEAKILTESLSIPMMVLIIPHPIDVSGGNHGSGTVDHQKYPDYDPRILTDGLEHLVSQLDLPYVNLFEPFLEGGVEKLYLKGGDDHWNDEGQKVAAEIVASYLIETNLLNE